MFGFFLLWIYIIQEVYTRFYNINERSEYNSKNRVSPARLTNIKTKRKCVWFLLARVRPDSNRKKCSGTQDERQRAPVANDQVRIMRF